MESTLPRILNTYYHFSLFSIFTHLSKSIIFQIIIILFFISTVLGAQTQVLIQETGQKIVLKDTAALGALYDEIVMKCDETKIERLSYYAEQGLNAAVALEKPAFALLFVFNIHKVEVRQKILKDTSILFSALRESKIENSRFFKNKDFISSVSIQIGDYYYYAVQNYERALYYYFEAYEANKSQYILSRVGSVYLKLGNYSSAIKYQE